MYLCITPRLRFTGGGGYTQCMRKIIQAKYFIVLGVVLFIGFIGVFLNNQSVVAGNKLATFQLCPDIKTMSNTCYSQGTGNTDIECTTNVLGQCKKNCDRNIPSYKFYCDLHCATHSYCVSRLIINPSVCSITAPPIINNKNSYSCRADGDISASCACLVGLFGWTPGADSGSPGSSN